MNYLLDSSAWIEYFEGSLKGEKVSKILRSEKVYSVNLIIAEIVSKFKRKGMDFNQAYRVLLSNSVIVELTSEIAKEAGILHADMKKKIKDFGLADAIILISARKIKAKVVTGDKHFKSFKEVLWLG